MSESAERSAFKLLQQLQEDAGVPAVGGASGAPSIEWSLAEIYELALSGAFSGGGGGGGTILTQDQIDAIDGAASPSGANVFATIADVGGGGGDTFFEEIDTIVVGLKSPYTTIIGLEGSNLLINAFSGVDLGDPGRDIEIRSGTGSAADTGNQGGAGGDITLEAGAASPGNGNGDGGPGGEIQIAASNGGLAPGNGTGGDGGGVTIGASAGGDSSAGIGGDGGNVNIYAGDGGFGGGGAGQAGSIVLHGLVNISDLGTVDPAIAGQLFSMDAAGLAAALGAGARYVLISDGP